MSTHEFGAGEAGSRLDSETVSISYGFAAADLDSDRLQRGQPLSRRGQIFVHERSHLHQALGSSVGVYLALLRRVQTRLAAMIAHRITEAGQQLRAPLIREVRSGTMPLPRPVREEVDSLIERWRLVDHVLQLYVGDVTDILGAPEELISVPFAGKFCNLQYEITQVWPRRDFTEVWREQQQTLRRDLDVDVDGEQEAFALASSIAGGGTGYAGTAECAAVATEYFPDRADALATAAEALPPTYGHLVQRVLGQLTDVPATSRIATALAVFDACLNPPLLPVHAGLRRGIRLRELHPELRTFDLVAAVSRVRPARNVDDCLRYADELCASLGWTPVSAVDRAVLDEDLRDAPVRLQIYQDARLLAAEYPAILLNPDVHLFGSGELVDRFHRVVSPVVTDFTDHTQEHPDGDRAVRLVQAGFQDRWLRQVLTGTPRVIDPPAGLGADIFRQILENACDTMDDEIGVRLPRPQVRT